MRRVATLLFLTLLAGCADFQAGPISKAIGREVREHDARRIELAKLTTFEWDEVFLFEPYTPRSAVCDTLGVQVKYCERVVRAESTDDGEMIIAFRKAGRVTHAELHFRFNGDFMPWESSRPIPRSKAVFRVTGEGAAYSGKVWFKLVPE